MFEVVPLVPAKRDDLMAATRKGGVDRPSDKTGAADEKNTHGGRSPLTHNAGSDAVGPSTLPESRTD